MISLRVDARKLAAGLQSAQDAVDRFAAHLENAMLNEIEPRLNDAKFIGDLKPIVADLAREVDERLSQLEAGFQYVGPGLDRLRDVRERVNQLETVALQHAKMLDPKVFNGGDAVDVDFTVQPAEAATDAPSEGETTEATESTETTKETPPPLEA